ncbi:DBH-like monooxygenase protein 1 isoform X2 [Orbicella faveolata]|uniref:DBH-like monooxygenase protein 1 isoform X2 n=1 Tax=Orbicella faveolata TaxID=48498 RepID=UPI0009E350DB|nr:DBH-like monooxygenase protein 1 isoform X2 [Orbicella faveolata]
MTIVPLCLFLLHLAALQASAELAIEHSFFAALDEDQNVNLYWNVSTEEKEIYFTVEAKTTGWVGFGISSGQGKMEGADIVIGWVKDGKTYFKDRHADGRVMPEVDSQQDYELISLKEEDGKTIMKIKRKFDTCDSEDNKIEAGTTKVIYAYHPDDPSSEDEIPMHSPQNRGARSLMLLNSLEKVPTLPSDTETFVLRHNRTVVSTSRTTYKCRVFEMPKFNEVRHIVKVEPVIQAGHEGMVHHMLLYECRDDFKREYLNYSGECYGPNMPPAITQCAGSAAIAAWAIGGKEFHYPVDAGFPIGKADSPKVLILEMHYDNPENKQGITDSSGLRFYHTKQLRKYDAGVLTVGAMVLDFMIIPPRQKSWETTGVCSKECTQEGFKDSTLPTGGINVFATLLHTHLAGRRTWLRHLRNGRELPDIVRDEHYDFNFQEYQLLQKEVHVASGDSLENVCIYSTEDRKTATKAGLGTTQEMCLSYVMYYPKVNLTNCRSTDATAFFSWRGRYIKGGDDMSKASFWTDPVNTGLKEAYRDSKEVVVFCNGIGNAQLPVITFFISKCQYCCFLYVD